MSDELIDLHLDHAKAKCSSEATLEIRRWVLRRLNEQLPYGLVYAATEQIEGWLAGLRDAQLARPTLAAYRYHVRAFFAWACAAGFLDGNPAASIPPIRLPQRIPTPITEEELARALSLPEPIRTASILAAFAGLRRSEIARAEREHITAELTFVPVGKGEEPGVVPTHPFLWQELRDRPPGRLILNSRGGPVGGHWLSDVARDVFDEYGMPDVHLHRLRHRYGTLIQEAYGDLRLTQECMRHKSVLSTQGYTLVAPGRRADAVASLPVPTMQGGPATDKVAGPTARMDEQVRSRP